MSRPQDDPYALKIYIDGSAAEKNPGDKCGFAGIIEYPESFNKESEQVFQEGYTGSTNNRMELKACNKAMEYIRKNIQEFKIAGICRFIIVTDAKYVHDYQHYATNWRKQGWVSIDGRPIENQDLWKQFLSLRAAVNVEIVWQEGKTSIITKQVDKAAKKAADVFSAKPDMGYKKGRISRSLAGRVPILPYPANGQTEIIRVFRYRSQGNKLNQQWKVDFDLYNPETKSFEKKHSAYIIDQSLIHRHRYYEVRFNDNSRYPLINEIHEIVNFGD